MTKLICLEAENFKRLKVVRIEPAEKGVTIISGNNGHGKSSVLDAIQAAIGGKKVSPQQPVRDGEDKSTIVAELDNLVIKRTFTDSGGGTLTVTPKGGSPIKSPQGVLDELFGPLSFDPLKFTQMSPKQQAEEIRKTAGLDLSELEAERDSIFEQRKSAKAILTERAAVVSNFKGKPEKIEPIEAKEISEKLRSRQEWEQKIGRIKSDITRKREQYFELEKKIKELQQEQERVREEGKNLSQQQEDEMQSPPIVETAEELMEKLSGIEEHNHKAREYENYMASVERKTQQTAVVNDLEKKLKECREKIEKTISEAPMPIEGMTLTEEGLFLKGIPFSQASQAEQIRASVEMCISTKTDLRLILIRDGSHFDAENLKLLSDLATEKDIQIMVERVGKNDAEIGVVIEDGEVIG